MFSKTHGQPPNHSDSKNQNSWTQQTQNTHYHHNHPVFGRNAQGAVPHVYQKPTANTRNQNWSRFPDYRSSVDSNLDRTSGSHYWVDGIYRGQSAVSGYPLWPTEPYQHTDPRYVLPSRSNVYHSTEVYQSGPKPVLERPENPAGPGKDRNVWNQVNQNTQQLSNRPSYWSTESYHANNMYPKGQWSTQGSHSANTETIPYVRSINVQQKGNQNPPNWNREPHPQINSDPVSVRGIEMPVHWPTESRQPPSPGCTAQRTSETPSLAYNRTIIDPITPFNREQPYWSTESYQQTRGDVRPQYDTKFAYDSNSALAGHREGGGFMYWNRETSVYTRTPDLTPKSISDWSTESSHKPNTGFTAQSKTERPFNTGLHSRTNTVNVGYKSTENPMHWSTETNRRVHMGWKGDRGTERPMSWNVNSNEPGNHYNSHSPAGQPAHIPRFNGPGISSQNEQTFSKTTGSWNSRRDGKPNAVTRTSVSFKKEEREYRCLGQWKENGLAYTYTHRQDVGTYECFVGSIISDNELYIKEAGEHCQRDIDPLHDGMKLTRIGSCFGDTPSPQPTTPSRRSPEPTKPWKPITAPPRGTSGGRQFSIAVIPVLCPMLLCVW